MSRADNHDVGGEGGLSRSDGGVWGARSHVNGEAGGEGLDLILRGMGAVEWLQSSRRSPVLAVAGAME